MNDVSGFMVSFFYFATFGRGVFDGPFVREDRIAGGACRRSRRSVTPSSGRIWVGRLSVCITGSKSVNQVSSALLNLSEALSTLLWRTNAATGFFIF